MRGERERGGGGGERGRQTDRHGLFTETYGGAEGKKTVGRKEGRKQRKEQLRERDRQKD